MHMQYKANDERFDERKWRDIFCWKEAHFRMEYFVYFKKMQRISGTKYPSVSEGAFVYRLLKIKKTKLTYIFADKSRHSR